MENRRTSDAKLATKGNSIKLDIEKSLNVRGNISAEYSVSGY